MAINQFQTTQYILDDVFVRFWNSLSFVRTANRNLEGDFKSERFATGQTLNYRLEERYMGGQGAAATSESRVQVSRPLTIDQQFHVMLDFSGFQLTFDRARDEPYLEMMNAPRAKTLANLVESYVAGKFQNQVYQTVGTPGVPVDFNTVLDANRFMTELAIPQDGKRFGGLTPRVSQYLSNDLYTSYNSTVNTGALMDGFVGHLSGFDMFETNFLTRHISGAGQAGGTPPAGMQLAGVVTNGPISSGNTITVGSLGQAPNTVVFNTGDIIQVAPASGVFFINPLNYQATTSPAQFVVQAPVVTLDGNTATITVNPTIVVGGARANISAAIPNGAQLLMYTSFNISLAYHTQALVFAAPPLKELVGGVVAATSYSDLYKLAMVATLGADVRNYQQYDRADTICGLAVNPEFAVGILS